MPEVKLRPLTIDDCTPKYVGWLNDPEVHRWLETRWKPQTIDTIRQFVKEHTGVSDRRLMAITVDDRHIGNLKIGPVHPVHNYANLSYFIGDRDEWGKGYTTAAVGLACAIGFKEMMVHRLQAGCYEGNQRSAQVLRRNGFSFEGRLHRQLKTVLGWADHLLFGRTNDQVAI